VTCQTCNIGYYSLTSTICQSCNPYCASCTTTPPNCDVCLPSFIKTGGLCSCNTGGQMYLAPPPNIVCQSCQTFNPLCTVCKLDLLLNGPFCDSCITGYYPDSTNPNPSGFCLPCLPNCDICSNSLTCTQCSLGYVPSNLNPNICDCDTAN